MTNTETVSTERKVWPLGGYAPGHYQNNCVGCGKDFIGDKRAVECLECAVANANRIIDEALSSRTQSPADGTTVQLPVNAEQAALMILVGENFLRTTGNATQSPAEWQVGAAKAAFWARGPLPYAGLDEYDIRLAEALRAASIPPPERSKEEDFTDYAYAAKDGWQEWNGGVCPVDLGTKVDFRDRGRQNGYFTAKAGSLNWTHWGNSGDIVAYRISALETPPLHKEGEAVYFADGNTVRKRVGSAFGEGDVLFCTPSAWFPANEVADLLNAAPAPVPVTKDE